MLSYLNIIVMIFSYAVLFDRFFLLLLYLLPLLYRLGSALDRLYLLTWVLSRTALTGSCIYSGRIRRPGCSWHGWWGAQMFKGCNGWWGAGVLSWGAVPLIKQLGDSAYWCRSAVMRWWGDEVSHPDPLIKQLGRKWYWWRLMREIQYDIMDYPSW